MKNQRGFAVIEGVLILIIIAMLGGVIWYVISQNKDTSEEADSSSSSKVEKSIEEYKPTTTVPDDWKIYKNQEYKVSFAYPAGWKVGVLKTEPGEGDPAAANASKLVLFSINSPNAVQSTDVSMRAYDIPAEQSVEQLRKNNEDLNKRYEDEPPTKLTSKEITFQGKKGFEVTIKQTSRDGETSTMIDYFVESNGYTFELPYIDPDHLGLEESIDVMSNLNYVSKIILDSVNFL